MPPDPSGWVRHGLGVAWVLGAALLTVAPALRHGFSLGPYDLLSRSGLTRVPGATVRNTVSGDQIAEMIPWSSQAWTQVHHGLIPLWNPLSGLGLPLAFNWQSAVFSLPALVSYAFPLHLAYTVQIVVTLVVAGTGAYALARVLGLGAIACATTGTIFELSGAFMGWLGWPHASVMSWSGWLFALAILICRGRHRLRDVFAFAVVVALAVYAGEPEIFAILAVSLAVFVVTVVVARFRADRNRSNVLRPLLDLSIAGVAGAALAAPLALPGAQVLTRSTRNSGTLFASTEVGRSLPAHDLVHILVQGYNGLPVAGNQVFGDAVYTDTATYVGVIAVALAVLGIARSWRRPVTLGFLALSIVTLAIVFLPPVQAVFDHVPLVQTVDWHRDLMVVGLCVAVLAGMGMDALVRSSAQRSTQVLVGGSLVAMLVLLGALWFAGTSGLSPLETTFRRDSLKWPLVTGSLALLVVAAVAVDSMRGGRFQPAGTANFDEGALSSTASDGRQDARGPARPRLLSAGRAAGLALLFLETLFLVVSGAQLWSSSVDGARATPAVTALSRAVGGSTVAFGVFTCYAGPGLSSLGVLPEANILFGIHEFDFYDPVLPRGYVQSWADLSHSGSVVPIYNSFCPAVTTTTEARRYGIRFVLVPTGTRGPSGAVFEKRIADEDLYRIPGAADATLTPASSDGHLPSIGATGAAVAVQHPSPSSLRIATSSPTAEVLRLRVTDEPGWSATIDGKPLQLSTYAGVMLQARVPPGRHVIELRYWPDLFTVGLVVAAACLITFVIVFVVARRRRHLHDGAQV